MVANECLICGSDSIEKVLCKSCWFKSKGSGVNYGTMDAFFDNLSVYSDVLKQALADGILTNDENAILGILRSRLQLPNWIHDAMVSHLCQLFHISQDPAYKKRALRGQGKLRTDQGVYVQSKAERAIADYLYGIRILFAYEPMIHLRRHDQKIIQIAPDFYLPEYGLYIEYLGMLDNEEYRKTWEFKQKLYSENGLKYITVDHTEEKFLRDVLTRKLLENGVQIRDQ